MASAEGELFVDLECGVGSVTATPTTSEEEGSGDSVSSCGIGRKTLGRAISGALSCNGVMSSESDTDSGDDFSTMSNVACGRVEVLVDKCSGGEETRDVVPLLEKRSSGEPRKKQNLKKSSKPPRPPKGPSLNASDLKLVKELSELAARKRARIERMKALRKMRETKRPASSSNLTAMIITVLFFVIIICQGAFSGSKVSKELLESPAPATTKEGLISIQLFNNAPASEMNQPSSMSFSSLEQPSSWSPQEQGRDT